NNPLAAGKPFINNWMPIFGDMLRLNMAVPVTQRSDPNFSSLGLIQAAVLGLTSSTYSTSALQFIPNMDGFPNGRRLEDDVTRIELQAVSGVVLASIGLWYDDYTGVGSPVTPKLLSVLGYSTGIQNNDTTFKTVFPYVQTPWSGYGRCGGPTAYNTSATGINDYGIGVSAPALIMIQNYPNPFRSQTTFKYHLTDNMPVDISIYDLSGKKVGTVISQARQYAGTYEVMYSAEHLSSGLYIANMTTNGHLMQSIKISVAK
ncbi:MAG: DUF4331 family protein, partial [Bacteroidia bacterium]